MNIHKRNPMDESTHFSSSPFYRPEEELAELVWMNGQPWEVSLQGRRRTTLLQEERTTLWYHDSDEDAGEKDFLSCFGDSSEKNVAAVAEKGNILDMEEGDSSVVKGFLSCFGDSSEKNVAAVAEKGNILDMEGGDSSVMTLGSSQYRNELQSETDLGYSSDRSDGTVEQNIIANQSIMDSIRIPIRISRYLI